MAWSAEITCYYNYRVYQRLLEDYWRLLNYWRLQCSVYNSKQLLSAYKTLANDSETTPHLQVRGSDGTVQNLDSALKNELLFGLEFDTTWM